MTRRIFAVGRIKGRTLRAAWAEYFAWRVEVRALLKVLHG